MMYTAFLESFAQNTRKAVREKKKKTLQFNPSNFKTREKRCKIVQLVLEKIHSTANNIEGR